MLVHGAIVPPRSVLEAVAAVVRSVPEPVVASAPPPEAKGFRKRLGRHRAGPDEDLVAAAEPMLDHVPLEKMRLPITGFGNLTTHDVNRLVELLREAAVDWPAPIVHFTGGTALDFPGDWSVWAKIGGDVDALSTMARGVPQAVEKLGYFLDRRQFRPMLSVATVTRATTGSFLESVVGALESFEGEDWVAEISLTKETFVNGRPETTEFQRIPLGG